MDLLFENTIGILYGVIGFVIMMSLVVFIHEFGHYYAARLCGVRVDIFSIGFGKKIFSYFDKNGCQWTLSYLPLGGYVKFFGDKSAVSNADNDTLSTMTDEDKKVSFYYKNLWQKLFIVFAGPLANIILCLVLMTGVYFFNGIYKIDPVVMAVETNKAASKAGIMAGDHIISIDGDEIEDAGQVTKSVIGSFGRPISVTVSRQGKDITFDNIIPDQEVNEKGDKFSFIGTHFANIPYIESVQEKSAAANAGIKIGDRIISVNGEKTLLTTDVIKIIRAAENDVLNLGILRNTQELMISVNPNISTDKDGNTRKTIGVVFSVPTLKVFEYDILMSLKEAYRQTVSIAVLSWQFFQGLFQGYADAEQLSGPIKIGSIAGDALQHDGFIHFFYIMAFISMSIGLVNLAPVPMLDGGHIVMYSFELITGIKPSKKVQEYAFKLGFSLIMTLMVFTILNDLGIVSFIKTLF